MVGSLGVTSTIGAGRSTAATSLGARSPRRAATTTRSVPSTPTASVSTNIFPHRCARIAPPLWQIATGDL